MGKGEGEGSGCRNNSLKVLNDFKDVVGDLFLLGLLAVVLVAWGGSGDSKKKSP
jgi:hypothetical protein